MAFTRDWQESLPSDDTWGFDIDDYILGLRVDVAERLEDMFEGFNAGETDVGINVGLFREQASIDTPAENKITLAAKESDDSKCEFFWKDEDGDERQLTDGGQLVLGKSTTPYPFLHNTTEEDTDGGRESRIVAKGEQSGGEVTTLGYIEFAHDGTSDDQKGRFRIVLNDGDDDNAPSKVAIEFASAGDIDVANSVSVLDEDDMASDSDAHLVTQQSLVAYVNATPHTGGVVQTVQTSYAGANSVTSVIPVDNTIPQQSEGEEIITLAITPTSATNKLKIEAVVPIGFDGSVVAIVCLFQDSTANALAVSPSYAPATLYQTVPLTHYMTAGTTSETTFKIRVGVSSGAITINGIGGGRKWGGVCKVEFIITELKV